MHFEPIAAEKIAIKFMAQHVGLKESQVKYIKKKYSIKSRDFSHISDEELDHLSYEIVQLHPTIGIFSCAFLS